MLNRQIARQNRSAGMKPNCDLRKPITQLAEICWEIQQ